MPLVIQTKEHMEKYWNSSEIGWVKANARRKPQKTLNVELSGHVILSKKEKYSGMETVNVVAKNPAEAIRTARFTKEYSAFRNALEIFEKQLAEVNPGFATNLAFDFKVV